jgi:transposase-like protein
MERFVSISEVSQFLAVEESTLYVWRHKGLRKRKGMDP